MLSNLDRGSLPAKLIDEGPKEWNVQSQLYTCRVIRQILESYMYKHNSESYTYKRNNEGNDLAIIYSCSEKLLTMVDSVGYMQSLIFSLHLRRLQEVTLSFVL